MSTIDPCASGLPNKPSIKKNPFKVKVKILDSALRVDVTGMRLDIPLPPAESQRLTAMRVLDSMKDLSGMFAAALAIALKESTTKVISPDDEKPAMVMPSNITPIK